MTKTTKTALTEAKKEAVKQNVSAEPEFDPLFTAELQAMNSIVKGIENIHKAIESRTKLIGLLYTEESKNHEMFAKAKGKIRQRLFAGVHSMSMDKFKTVHKALADAEQALEKVLTTL